MMTRFTSDRTCKKSMITSLLISSPGSFLKNGMAMTTLYLSNPIPPHRFYKAIDGCVGRHITSFSNRIFEWQNALYIIAIWFRLVNIRANSVYPPKDIRRLAIKIREQLNYIEPKLIWLACLSCTIQ